METEQAFDIIRNSKGHLLFCVRVRREEPENPRLLFDGKDAVLYRTPKRAILFPNISDELIDDLERVKTVLFAEIFEDNLEREYTAKVKLVKEVPK